MILVHTRVIRGSIFLFQYKMFSSGTHEERLLERTIQQIYEGRSMASILTGLSWRDRMLVLKNEGKLQKYVARFKELVGEG